MLSAAIPVRVLAEEERLQENTLEQFDTGAADNSGASMMGDIDTSEISNESIKNDSDLANPISHQAKPQVSLTSDMSSDSEQSTKAAVSGYQHSDSATNGSVTLTVEWNDPVLGQPTTFHVSATGGSGSYLFRMDAPSYSNPNEYAYESVADPSRGEWTKFTDACASHDFTFTTTATGSYNFRFYLMDKASGVYYLRTNSYIQVADDAYPSVASLVNKAVSQAKQKTDGSEYEMALYLHDWLLDQLEYVNSLKWTSAESALTRGLGTCQAYESAYAKLLSAAGIENAETRDAYDGHTWNAVKLDDEWYQVDCTWDDTSDNFYGDLDQRHLYFCLTDELMAIAHPGHEKIYSADGYAARSTSLKDNYFVRNGKADEWAGKYFNRIQKHLDAREAEFSIDADNQSFPPSISGIQNGVVAYAMNQQKWTANKNVVDLAVESVVSAQSNSKWFSKYIFKVFYPEMFTVEYFDAGSAAPSGTTTEVKFGEPTGTATVSELGFGSGRGAFSGWRCYRECDGKWWARTPSGPGWVGAPGGVLPEGCTYILLRDGVRLDAASRTGVVRLYAQYDGEFTVEYFDAGSAAPSGTTTEVKFGEPTGTATVSELGFGSGRGAFSGWRCYRECDGKWWARTPSGPGWVGAPGGVLPEGCTYILLRDGVRLDAASRTGVVRLYAQYD